VCVGQNTPEMCQKVVQTIQIDKGVLKM